MQLADLPSRRVEAWKYSDLQAALGGELPAVAPAPLSAPPKGHLFRGLRTVELVFEDGRLAHWPSEGVRKAPHIWSKEAPGPPHETVATMGRLAAANATDEWMPIVEAGDESRPIWLRIVGGGAPVTAQMRVGIIVPEGRQLDLIETYEGPMTGLANILIEIFVAKGGCMRRSVLHSAERGALVSTGDVHVGSHATYTQFVLSEGAKLARIETHVAVEGEGAQVELNGVYLCASGRHADLTSIVTHKAPNGKTQQLIKGVARKGGRGVFQGKIVVEQGAQKTDARQHHHGMLLEDGAEIFAKPELMIFADDVQCAHGNTAGGLDANALFYLRARGVPEAEARALLTEAFLLEAVPEWVAGDIRIEIEARIAAWLRSAP